MIWVQIVIALVMAIVGELLRPKQKFNNPEPSAIGDFSFPTADASRVIPVFFGTCKMQGPNTVWFGDLSIVAIKKKVKTGWFSSSKIILGFKYSLGVQFVFSYGEIDEFIALLADDKPLNVSNKTFTGDVCSFNINSPKILSTDEPNSGVVGPATLYKGTFEQPVNAYLGAQWADADMSAFRPLCHLVFEKVYLGNTETPPPITLIAKRCPNSLGMTGGMHDVDGDANIACAVYEVMTDRLWGMKIPLDKIDTDSLIECGETLYAEGLGVSMLIQTAMLGKDLMAEMLRHADAVVYADPVTGLYTMKLAREDYDIDDLMEFNNSNIKPDTFEFSRVSWEMTKNTIIVQYTDRETFDTKPVQYQDSANIDVRGGMIDSEEINFLGFSKANQALRAAARACKIKSSPLVRAEFSTDRTGYQLRPGSCFKLVKPDRGIASLIMRVISISYGTLDDPAVKITAMEDIFGINGLAFDEPSESDWTTPLGDPEPITVQRLLEAPAFGSEDFATRYLMTLASRSGANDIAYDVWTRRDDYPSMEFENTASVDQFTPSAILVGSYLESDDEVDTVGFIVENFIDEEDVISGTDAEREDGTQLLLIDNEWIAWKEKIDNGDGTWTIRGNWRGVLDTVPQDHADGTRVWFVSEGAGLSNGNGYGYGSLTSSEVFVEAKYLPRNPLGVLDFDDATEMDIETDNRARRPLPPGRVRIGTDRVAGGSFAGLVTVSWAHRNRKDDTLAPQTELSRDPESDQRYNLRFYRTDTNALLVQALNFDATAAAVQFNYTGNIRMELETVRDELESWTKWSPVFTYDPAGSLTNTIVADTTDYVLDGGAP